MIKAKDNILCHLVIIYVMVVFVVILNYCNTKKIAECAESIQWEKWKVKQKRYTS